MCQAGTRQSPVDLDPQVAVHGNFEPLVLLNYDKAVAANITNNGHTGKCKCELRVSVHRGLMNKIPTRCSKLGLFFFVFCHTCFGRYIHPSSGASTVRAGMV
jgi:hypothetical protein